jgi:putative hydrolase of the HAD superfamily
MTNYKCIFFDLDHTLWDYETNSRETLQDLYNSYELQSRGVSNFDLFLGQFQSVNNELWHQYDHGKITSDVIREERFKRILSAFDAYEEKLSKDISYEYLVTCPVKGNLMPYAIETLNYLSEKYHLTVVTNGFEDIQHMKLNSTNILSYFRHIVTSQRAGHKKPAREIFDFALAENSIANHEAVMIGDNLLTDISGARNASIDTIFFNPDRISHEENVNHEITTLQELCALL